MEHDLEVDFVKLLEVHIHNVHGMQCKECKIKSYLLVL